MCVCVCVCESIICLGSASERRHRRRVKSHDWLMCMWSLVNIVIVDCMHAIERLWWTHTHNGRARERNYKWTLKSISPSSSSSLLLRLRRRRHHVLPLCAAQLPKENERERASEEILIVFGSMPSKNSATSRFESMRIIESYWEQCWLNSEAEQHSISVISPACKCSTRGERESDCFVWSTSIWEERVIFK